jgi:RimJ/RimL family protein N-acetyltransferase
MSDAVAELPIVTLKGQLVGLGPIRRDLAALYAQWWNDPDITLPLAGHVWPSTLKDQEAWYEKYGERGDGSTVHFLVYELSTLRPIGVVCLFSINYRNQTAWASSFIGAKELWGKGYGTEARRLLLEYAFGPCGLNNVTVAIHADNTASLRVAEKLGYRLIGTQRQGVRRGGAYVDIVLLDVLASEFVAR